VWPSGCKYGGSTMYRLRTGLACLLLALAVGSTASAEVHPRLVCADSCSDDGNDQPQPCGDDCATCACCVVFHLVKPATSVDVLALPVPATRPYFVEPTPLVSREGSDIFHIPKSPLA
jgi:hypothetical protein